MAPQMLMFLDRTGKTPQSKTDAWRGDENALVEERSFMVTMLSIQEKRIMVSEMVVEQSNRRVILQRSGYGRDER